MLVITKPARLTAATVLYGRVTGATIGLDF